KLAIQEPATTGPVFDALAPETFGHPTYRAVFDAIMAAGGACGEAATQPHSWATAIMDQAREDVVKHLVTELGVEQIAVDAETLRPYAQAILARLQEVWVGDQIAQLKAMLSRMRPSDDETAYNSLFADLLAMEQYRRELQAEAVKVVFE
ncbi:MAG: DNA primase, partial [Corynebacterium sp.]|nr:DNA primase [Corynebacterium sp.]